MGQAEVKTKIKVFISSRCGQPKYDSARMKLKGLIENTNLATVYLFEDGIASTQSAEQDYVYALDDSDVCLFLIDNLDGVTDAVLREIHRAKTNNKKSLYLFCKECKQEPTQIQKELMGAQGARYYEANSFEEFISIGYTSLINDITTIYRHYCRGRLEDKEFENRSVSVKEIEAVASESLNKQLIKEVDQSKEYMSSIIFKSNREINNTSEFDALCKEFLKVLLGEKHIRNFNTSLLLEELKKKQSNNLYEVVELRWKSIQAYYSDDLETSIQYMQQALETADKNLLPTWIKNDILIDLRNIYTIKNITENCYFDEKVQKILDKSNEFLFYPVLDRLEKEYNQELIKKTFKNKTESPYTTHIGNSINNQTDYITNIFIVAVFNGSLTHILKTIDRLKSMTFNLCELYDDWVFRVLLLKFSMIDGSSSDIKKIISTFNEILGKMNDSDTISIYEMASSVPIAYKKLIAKLEVFTHLGFYFSDKDYEKIAKELMEEINKWICDDKKIIALGDYIFKSLHNNWQRLDNTEIAKICCKILSSKCRRWYDEVFKLISKMGISDVKTEIANELISEIIKIIENEEEKNNCYRLEGAIISIRKSNSYITNELEQCVLEKMPEFYNTLYSLEVLTDTVESSEVHIQRYIEDIKSRNETQGLNGLYSGYVDNPYLIIMNIIKNNQVYLSYELIEKIATAVKDTLLAPKQTVGAKIDAIQLFVFLKNFQHKANYDLSKLFNDLVEDQLLLETGLFNILLEKKSKLTLQFNFLLLKLCFNAISDIEILEMISIYNNQEDYEKIESLNAISNIMDNQFSTIIDEKNLYIFVQYVLGLCNTKSHHIRYNAVEALLRICTQKTSTVIMTQLSKMMDVDSAPIKYLILNEIDNIKQYNKEIATLILQKAKVDNHFLVRKKAFKLTSM